MLPPPLSAVDCRVRWFHLTPILNVLILSLGSARKFIQKYSICWYASYTFSAKYEMYYILWDLSSPPISVDVSIVFVANRAPALVSRNKSHQIQINYFDPKIFISNIICIAHAQCVWAVCTQSWSRRVEPNQIWHCVQRKTKYVREYVVVWMSTKFV